MYFFQNTFVPFRSEGINQLYFFENIKIITTVVTTIKMLNVFSLHLEAFQVLFFTPIAVKD